MQTHFMPFLVLYFKDVLLLIFSIGSTSEKLAVRWSRFSLGDLGEDEGLA